MLGCCPGKIFGNNEQNCGLVLLFVMFRKIVIRKVSKKKKKI